MRQRTLTSKNTFSLIYIKPNELDISSELNTFLFNLTHHTKEKLGTRKPKVMTTRAHIHNYITSPVNRGPEFESRSQCRTVFIT